MRKYALITGATGGLGKAFVNQVASMGYHLILTDLKEESLDSLQEGIHAKYGVDVTVFPANIKQEADLDKIWRHLTTNDIRLSLVVNVAGIDTEGLFDRLIPENVMDIAQINVMGTLQILSRCIQYQDKSLDIINIASMAGFYSMPYKAVYSATKSFIINISRSLDTELTSRNIRVLAVCPAGLPTRGDIIEKIDSQGILGSLTTLNTTTVARNAFLHLKRGKQVYVPGVINAAVVSLTNLLPKKFLAQSIYRRWAKTTSRIETR